MMVGRFLSIFVLISTASLVSAKELPAPTGAIYRSQVERLDGLNPAQQRQVEWKFERTGNVVQITDSSGQRAERWVRDETGRIWYSRIFHAERKIIEYQPADLALAAITGSWARVEGVIDPALLKSLERANEDKLIEGHPASIYRGTIEGIATEIWWLDDLAMPAFVHKRTGQGSSTLQLVRLQGVDGRLTSQPASGGLPDYEVLDFSDLGDRHHDPFIEGLMRYEGLWFGHGH
jgi:SH3-like domain-containing protein